MAAAVSGRLAAATSVALPSSASAPASARGAAGRAAAGVPENGEDVTGASETVIVDLLHVGRYYGIMEMMEGLSYQCSVVANPWAEVYTISKYDLVRNTSKTILHRLFCDCKVRLSDERLLQRMRQKSRWNSYKRNLLDDIRARRANDRGTIDRLEPSRRMGAGDLSGEDYERLGNGGDLWDKRAETPPKVLHTKNNMQVRHIFHVQCSDKEDGTKEVAVQCERRDTSMVALDERILMTITTARFRDKIRKSHFAGKDERDGGSSGSMTPGAPAPFPEDCLGSQRAVSSDSHPTKSHGSVKLPDLAASRWDRSSVQRTQELETQAKTAAEAYLTERSCRVEALHRAAQTRTLESMAACVGNQAHVDNQERSDHDCENHSREGHRRKSEWRLKQKRPEPIKPARASGARTIAGLTTL